MNRWIEHEDMLINLDYYSGIDMRGTRIYLDQEFLNFTSYDDAKEFYGKIKEKLKLTEWE